MGINERVAFSNSNDETERDQMASKCAFISKRGKHPTFGSRSPIGAALEKAHGAAAGSNRHGNISPIFNAQVKRLGAPAVSLKVGR